MVALKKRFWIAIYNIRKYFFQIALNICKDEILNTAKHVGKNFYLGGLSKVTRHTILGNNVNFNGMNITGSGEVKIGNYFHSGIECLIITQSHKYENAKAIPYDKTFVCKNVEIGDFVWFGSRVTILPDTKIGEGVIVQAGSVVHGNIPPYAIIGGNPAKVFKYRDVEEFKKLKEQKCFN